MTADSVLKMCAIVTRARCGLPVVLMGECGCGKTELVKCLTEYLGAELVNLGIHGGTTEQDILSALERAQDLADIADELDAEMDAREGVLPPGTRVKVVNLEQRVSLNGVVGTIHGYNRNRGRYEVLVDAGTASAAAIAAAGKLDQQMANQRLGEADKQLKKLRDGTGWSAAVAWSSPGKGKVIAQALGMDEKHAFKSMIPEKDLKSAQRFQNFGTHEMCSAGPVRIRPQNLEPVDPVSQIATPAALPSWECVLCGHQNDPSTDKCNWQASEGSRSAGRCNTDCPLRQHALEQLRERPVRHKDLLDDMRSRALCKDARVVVGHCPEWGALHNGKGGVVYSTNGNAGSVTVALDAALSGAAVTPGAASGSAGNKHFCPKAHLLTPYVSSDVHAGLACDGCKAQKGIGCSILGCTTCNYNLCKTCAVSRIGIRVTVRGLVDTTQHNGRTGTVAKATQAGARFEVNLDDRAGAKAVTLEADGCSLFEIGGEQGGGDVVTLPMEFVSAGAGSGREVYVFLDEINTCAHMGLICEAICSRTVHGRPPCCGA